MLAARLRAYVPGGAALQQMPQPLRWSAMVARNDVGSLTLTYASVAAGGEVVERALTDGVEIALEVTQGETDAFGVTQWTEPRGCRFVMIDRNRDIADPTKSISLTLPSYAWLLSKARNYTTAVYPPDHAQAGKRGWTAPTAGEILADLITENTARGGYAAQVTPVFDATDDAAGVAWPALADQAFDLGTDYAAILDSLSAAGAMDWQTQARGLYAWLPDSAALSPDLSTSTTLLLTGGSPGRASTPDTAALDITGDIDVRVHVAMDDWTPSATQGLIGKYISTGNQRSWRLTVLATGVLRLVWSTNGSTSITADSTAAVSAANGTSIWVRVTLDVDNGAAGRDIKFWTSSDGETWTQLGATVTQATVTSIFNSTAEVAVGSGFDSGTQERLAGKVSAVEIRNGIAGTVVANPVFGEQPAGTTSFVDSTGLTWTVTAPASIAESGTAPVTLHPKHVGAMPTSESIAEMVGRMYVRTDAGGVAVATDPAVVGPWGVPEGFLQVGSVADEAAAVAVGEAELERVGKVRGQYTRDLVLTDDAPAPLIDYWPGCWIKAPGAGGASERLRVQSVTLTRDANGLSGSAVLNDRIVADDERRARNLSALAGGGTISPGGPPAPIAVDPEASRVPSTPTGLDAVAGLYFTGPTPRGVVTATWNPVSTATDSGALTISGYELQWRIGAGEWQTLVTPEVSASIPDLAPGDVITVRVRAVGARTALPSAWSATDSVTVSGDTTAPGVPNAPTISSRLGVVTVTWDGGPTMPADFARVEVALGDTVTPTTVRGSLLRAGSLPIAGETYGSTRYARLRAVDTSGNASAWSTVSDQVLVVAVQGPDLEADSVTANAVQAGTLTGDLFAGNLVVGNRFTTSEDGTGQRVEFDSGGIRLIDAAEEVRVELPTTTGADPTFRGRVQADGLTVREGATFYSALNEFAPDSAISLAEQVSGPLAGPIPTMTWEGVALERTAFTGSLGTFALVPSEIVGVGRDLRSSGQRIMIMQKRPGGTRVWFYDMDGGLSDLDVGGVWTPFLDWPDWEITGAYWTDNATTSVWLGKWSENNWWYFRRSSTGEFVLYPSANPTTRNVMGHNGTDVLVAEKISTTAYRLRRMDTAGTEATVLENVNTTGLSPLTPGLAFVYKGTADFGTTKWVVSHQDTNTYRTFTSAGVWDPDSRWDPPVQKMGGFWNAADSLFYTVGADGVLYKHTALNWTDSTLDTWHVGQSFYDANATGGTHETALGTITSFTMKKRAQVRFSLADVPYSGEVDDPNQWRLYAKRGAAPASNLSDMKLQASGAYTEKTYLMTYVPTTGGTAALEFGTFPDGTPARLYSARTLPSDPTKRIFEVRGDGSGRWGTLEISDTGVITDTTDTGWVNLTLLNSWANATGGGTASYRRIGQVVYLRGRVDSGSTTTIAQLPAGLEPSANWTTYGYGGGTGSPVTINSTGAILSASARPLTYLYASFPIG
jgi:hypothetical protein